MARETTYVHGLDYIRYDVIMMHNNKHHVPKIRPRLTHKIFAGDPVQN